MVSGAEAYFQDGMRTIYSFYFCMYEPLVLIARGWMWEKKQIFNFLIRMSEGGVGG